jgi:hypothetical protein
MRMLKMGLAALALALLAGCGGGGVREAYFTCLGYDKLIPVALVAAPTMNLPTVNVVQNANRTLGTTCPPVLRSGVASPEAIAAIVKAGADLYANVVEVKP